MLSAGRGFNLEGKIIFCRDCLWNGVSTLLKTRLAPLENSALLLYVYSCPECAGFDLAVRGNLLNFTKQPDSTVEEEKSLIDSRTRFDNGKSKKKRSH
jgi:hypothetical protein